MTNAKISATLPDWVKDHIRRYLATNGADGHMMAFPHNPSGAVPTLLLTTTGRRSGEKFVFPLIYGTTGDSYVVVASKGGAPEQTRLVSQPGRRSSSSIFRWAASICRPPRGPRPATSEPSSGAR